MRENNKYNSYNKYNLRLFNINDNTDNIITQIPHGMSAMRYLRNVHSML